MYPAMPPLADEPVEEIELGDAQMVPDGAKDVENISHLSFIRMFISGRLVFPDEPKEFCFGYEDLTDLGPIGEGAYGRVNKMRHNETNKLMAVKKVRLISKNDDGEMNRSMRRLRQEVDAIKSASDCPQIVRFFGLTFHEGDCLVCMELMDISLEKLYQVVHTRTPGCFDERILGHVAVSILKALNHLKSEVKIIHRDVKPSNILLDIKGMIKLCDFGISGYLVNSVAQTREAGCRPYMAPERLLTNSTYDIRSDVWSLGITLKEVAIGEFPYPKKFNDNELFFQLQQVVYGDAPIMGPSEVYSYRTVQFINSCLVKETAARPNYTQLMTTEFFMYYDRLEGTNMYVSKFVRAALIELQRTLD